jgi:hypothetical protein
MVERAGRGAAARRGFEDLNFRTIPSRYFFIPIPSRLSSASLVRPVFPLASKNSTRPSLFSPMPATKQVDDGSS